MPTFPNLMPKGQVREILNNSGLRKNQFAGSRAPVAGDDVSAGYEPGSVWLYGNRQWRCTSNAAGAAMWREDVSASAMALAQEADGQAALALAASAAADGKATDALSAWTAWDEIAEVDPHRFGAMGFTFDQMVAAGGVGMDAVAEANSTAFEAANALLAARGGGIIRWRGLIYPVARSMRRGDNVFGTGVGTGRYLPQSAGPAAKSFTGTVFLAYGTGTKDLSFPGITSGELNGGWRPDPDNPGQYFRLWSAYNADAAGAVPATPRLFSALIVDDLTYGFGGWSNITVLPWRGTDGVSDYRSSGAPLWGADWDFGYVVKDSEYVRSSNLNVSGPWREAAHALILTVYQGDGRWNRGEQNLFCNCQFEGRVGVMVRAPDVWRVTGLTADTIRIAWTAEQYFAAEGSFRGSNSATYSYTSVARDGADLVFSGVSPDPVGIAHIRHGSSGLANTMYRDCLMYDLHPQDGATPQSHGVQSSCLEVSGFPLRGLQFHNSKTHSRGRVIMHLHMTADQNMEAHQFEGGGFVIASPEGAASPWAPQSTYETRSLLIDNSNGLGSDSDLRLFTPRNAFVQELQIAPRGDYSGNLVIQALRAGKLLINAIVSGGRWGVTTPTGAEVLGVGDDGLIQLRRPDGTLVAQMGASGHISFYTANGTEVFRIPSSGVPSLRGGTQLSFVGGTALVNYPAGEYFAVREGTDVRLQVTGSTIRSGQDGVVELGTPSYKFMRAHLSDGLFVNNQKVVGARQSAIADSAGGDEQAKINAILAVMRTHGLIST